MAERLAKDIAPGSYVNIGIGMPELVANYLKPEDEILLHSENGILGMGPAATGEDIDGELINAGGKSVPGRDTNCVDCTLSALSTFLAYPVVAAPSYLKRFGAPCPPAPEARTSPPAHRGS